MNTLSLIFLLTNFIDSVAVESKTVEGTKKRPIQVAYSVYKQVSKHASLIGPAEVVAASVVVI